MNWTVAKVRHALNGRLVGNIFMRQSVCEALLFLPPQTIEFVCSHVWFLSSPEDAWAMTFKGSELKNRSLIFISDELLQQTDEQIRYTILHEVGHVMLGHRNSIGYEQTASEIRHQEEEADAFAKKYLGLV